MNRIVISLAVLSITVGCGGPTAPSTPVPSFEVSWEFIGDDGNFAKGSGGGGSLRVGDNTLEIKDQQVFVNGKLYGPLRDGDKVKVDPDGSLFVNGEKRTCE